MSASLTPDNEAFLAHVVATGQFLSRDAALNEAIRQLRAQLPPTQPTRRRHFRSTHEWLAAFDHWVENHNDVTAVADDDRENIY
jgi:hypothetical protein